MDALIEKLQQYEQRYNQINDLLVSDDIISKPKEMTKLPQSSPQNLPAGLASHF